MPYYLSRGKKVSNNTINCRGKNILLPLELMDIWEKGRSYSEADPKNIHRINRMQEEGILLSAEGNYYCVAYNLLSKCILEPTHRNQMFPLPPIEKWILNWLTGAGLRLTIAELVCLHEKEANPDSELLGDENCQTLTAAIYETTDILDDNFDSRMRWTPSSSKIIQGVLGLLRKKYIELR